MIRSLALAALIAVSGCAAPEPTWVETDVAAPSESLLWQVVIRALQHEGFPVGHGLDPVNREATSGWANDLAPFRGKGMRRRAIVRLQPADEGGYAVEVRVEVEKNMDIVRPLDPAYAEWEPTADDEDRAKLVLQAIRSQVAIGSDADLFVPE